MRVLAIVGLVLFLLAQSAVSQVPDDKLIVPGQRIGKWTLEMTIDQLLQMNGPRNLKVGAAPGIPGSPLSPMPVWFRDSNGEIWWHFWENILFSAATRGRDAQRVEYIFTFDEDFKTEKGIVPGVPREEVESVYGKPTAVTRAGLVAGRVRLIYDEIGLAFIVSPQNESRIMFVFRPGTARTLWNI